MAAPARVDGRPGLVACVCRRVALPASMSACSSGCVRSGRVADGYQKPPVFDAGGTPAIGATGLRPEAPVANTGRKSSVFSWKREATENYARTES